MITYNRLTHLPDGETRLPVEQVRAEVLRTIKAIAAEMLAPTDWYALRAADSFEQRIAAQHQAIVAVSLPSEQQEDDATRQENIRSILETADGAQAIPEDVRVLRANIRATSNTKEQIARTADFEMLCNMLENDRAGWPST